MNTLALRFFTLVGFVTVVGGILGIIVVLLAGYWLPVDAEPKQADAIICLGGSPTRAFYSADLYNQGYAPKVYISRVYRQPELRMLDELGVFFPRQEDLYMQILLKKGVPKEGIVLFGDGNISTVEEAEVIRRLMGPEPRTLLIVTSPFHTRRAGYVYTDQLPEYDVTVLGSPYEPLPKRWWAYQNSAMQVVTELAKIVYYKLGGAFHSGDYYLEQNATVSAN